MAAPLEAVLADELESVNPATLERVGSVRRTRPEEVADHVAEARQAQHRWDRLGPRGRARVLAAAVGVLLDEKDEIARTICAETAKPFAEALTNDVWVAVDHARWLSKNAGSILKRQRLRFPQLNLKHKRGWIVYEPLGVVVAISPWNYPFSIPFVQTAGALAAGNAVVLKPSELTPLTGVWVARVFERAGAPEGLVQIVHGEAEIGDALVRAPGVDRILFTGSTAVGRRIAAAAAELLRPVTLELGGKDAMIVFADADLERAAEGARFGAFGNCGQTCVGVERIYVERPRYEDFVAAFSDKARSLRIGDELGPLISERQRERVEALVVDAVERGARVVTGGGRPTVRLPGWFYEPTVLADVPTEARIGREEIFGPVVTIEPFGTEAEAVRRANATSYGLGGSVWTRDRERARRVASQLETGMVWTNDYGYSWGTAQAPWGGVKESGLGRVASRHGLYELSRIRYVDADRGRVRVPWWFPYDERLDDGYRGALDVLYGKRFGALWRRRRGLLRLGSRYLGRG